MFPTLNSNNISDAYYLADYIQSKGTSLNLPVPTSSAWKIRLMFNMEAYGGELCRV